ncbi:MAG TPA: peptidoglycan DD-metalloendopeptidase family protein [Cellulomonas sp.]|uniref:peptidoglycan DD-metalloendopeptidase family protein n=1 Tax=Cellulomonas sp. TaxID=40001 RepID=UPI002E2F696C|nr:peptidoglycan DD-metalloendopeptidase family protein [Cellulomonas sp.]HEX5331549.1 peptidoglycan DD-metalloendopeptidase family protein [Cellulomonas sp.]
MSRRPSLARLLATVLVAVLAALTASAGPASADALSDRRKAAEQQAAANQKAHDQLAASLEDINANLAQAVLDLQTVEQRLPEAQTELLDAQATLERSQREAAIIAARLQDAKDQETAIGTTIAADAGKSAQIRVAIGQMAREAYKGGGGVSSVSIVLDAQSTEDFIQQYGLVSTALRTQSQSLDALRQIEAQDRNNAARLVAIRERVTELKAAADQKVVEADQARQAAADRKAEIEQLVTQQAEKKATIETEKAATEAEQARIDAEAAQVAAELAQIIAAQRAALEAAAKAKGKKVAPAGPIGNSLFANPTSVNPIYVTSEYGMRMHPILHYVRLHAGIDLRTYCNTPIYAGRAGTVQWAQMRFGFGNQVMVDHGFVNGNSLMSSYNHMTSFVVHAGQQVNQGTLLGYSGNTGTSGGCHLHFEVYVNGATVNPRPLLGL